MLLGPCGLGGLLIKEENSSKWEYDALLSVRCSQLARASQTMEIVFILRHKY